MRIYISVDMEGISGITDRAYTSKGDPFYPVGQQLATADTNAAIRGAFDAGAKEVIVADMHANSYNLLVDQLDPRALLLVGTPHTPRFPFLDASIHGMFLVGYHAMAGTAAATLEHTMSSLAWHRFQVNSQFWGELAIDATLAAEAGVPVVMVSGDDKLCDEAHAFLGPVETACVKHGVGRTCALCLSPQQGQLRVYEAAHRAVRRLASGDSFPMMPLSSPVDVAITYKHTVDADAACGHGSVRLNGYTVQRRYERLSEMYGGLWADQRIQQRVSAQEE